jgi:hypothetical protein
MLEILTITLVASFVLIAVVGHFMVAKAIMTPEHNS